MLGISQPGCSSQLSALEWDPPLVPKVTCRSSRISPRAKLLVSASAVQPADHSSEQTGAVQQLVVARGLDHDPVLVAHEVHLAFQYLSSQPGALPQQVQHPAQLVHHALQLTDLMANGSTCQTLHVLKRHPALLTLQPQQVADRVLQLKLLMPAADISRLLYQKPTLLLISDVPGVVGAALKQLHALMPGIPVEAKLHEGGTVFWSFCSLLQDGSSSSSKGSASQGLSQGSSAGQQSS